MLVEETSSFTEMQGLFPFTDIKVDGTVFMKMHYVTHQRYKCMFSQSPPCVVGWICTSTQNTPRLCFDFSCEV